MFFGVPKSFGCGMEASNIDFLLASSVPHDQTWFYVVLRSEICLRLLAESVPENCTVADCFVLQDPRNPRKTFHNSLFSLV